MRVIYHLQMRETESDEITYLAFLLFGGLRGCRTPVILNGWCLLWRLFCSLRWFDHWQCVLALFLLPECVSTQAVLACLAADSETPEIVFSAQNHLCSRAITKLWHLQTDCRAIELVFTESFRRLPACREHVSSYMLSHLPSCLLQLRRRPIRPQLLFLLEEFRGRLLARARCPFSSS